ncbi:hypothetical protein C0Q70_20361 [Pomacea canaliculata]|uniref:PLAC domain-containing protein n=1 Tax=Pomacea canaliculata TaxID=400727 RepID=A0A2T7NFB5_POMCA|nr:A disintegrin and metalloproteinase with thrombospondin motifs 7-like [Pomacea canaliculata]PVD19868.1 hypothetical protein C0Q70_20361 [Pomacea canaliculata]
MQPLPEDLQTVLLSDTNIHLNLGPVKEGGATDLTLSNSTSVSQENNEIGLIQNDHANADPSPANPSDGEEKTQRDQRNRSQSKSKPEKDKTEVEGVNKAESIQGAGNEGLGHVKAEEMLNGLLNPVEGGAEEGNSVNARQRLGAGRRTRGRGSGRVGKRIFGVRCVSMVRRRVETVLEPLWRWRADQTVSCLRVSTGARMDSDFCSIMGKPNAIQECSPHNCSDWEVTEWSQCSALCGYATRVRNVTCPEKDLCDPRVKPQEVDICQLEPCTAWVTGGWSKCSKTCDGGSQERLVQCVNMTSQQASMECDEKVKPEERQGCNMDECPKLDNAFSVTCESNEMSFKVCRMLRKLGLCQKDYVQAKCCRTCADHSRQAPEIRKASRR